MKRHCCPPGGSSRPQAVIAIIAAKAGKAATKVLSSCNEASRAHFPEESFENQHNSSEHRSGSAARQREIQQITEDSEPGGPPFLHHGQLAATQPVTSMTTSVVANGPLKIGCVITLCVWLSRDRRAAGSNRCYREGVYGATWVSCFWPLPGFRAPVRLSRGPLPGRRHRSSLCALCGAPAGPARRDRCPSGFRCRAHRVRLAGQVTPVAIPVLMCSKRPKGTDGRPAPELLGRLPSA